MKWIDDAVRRAKVLVQAGDLTEAEDECRKVLDFDFDHPGAHYLLGVCLISHNCAAEAAEEFRRSVTVAPDQPDAWSNLGFCLNVLRQPVAAEDACRRAIALNPRHFTALSNLGNALQLQGRCAEAVAAYRASLALSQQRGTHQNLLLALNYVPGVAPQEIYAEHVRWAERYANPLAGNWAHRNDRDPDRRLRVGYVSPDFCRHSVAFFLEPLLEAHDRRDVKVYCYSDTAAPDEVTERLRHHVDRWRDFRGRKENHVRKQIWEDDRIDILIDLAGHTAGNRLLDLARRLAPVQMTYLGYPNTTGVAAMQYRITDAWADPVGVTDAFHTERLIRLPRCAWCYRPPEESPVEVAPPPCLLANHVTFGSFNKLAKISPVTLDTWAELLRHVPGSRLVLKARDLGDADVRRRMADAFASRGVEPARVEFLGPVRSLAEHLSMYARIDIALDTFPYHGTTTTCDALYNGVPVVTQAGQVHVSRVGVSLLHSVGLEELVAQTPQQYVEIAARLAGGSQKLRQLRTQLRPRMVASPLMDSRGLAQEMERAYRTAWRAWCDSPSPTGDAT